MSDGGRTPASGASSRERLVFCHRFLPRTLSDEGDELGVAHVWSRTVAGRLRASGAEVLAHVGSTVLATFDAADLADAIEVGLDLLDEADEAKVPIGLGVALGLLKIDAARGDEPNLEYGAALERAQTLASRVPAGEIALDAESRQKARGLLLFAKQISPGHGLKGYVVDRTHPRRDASAVAMKRLGEPLLPPATRSLVFPLRDILTKADAMSRPAPWIVLRGPPGAGAIELLQEVRQKDAGRSRLFLIGASPTAAVPLGSLRAMVGTYDLAQTAVAAHRSTLELLQAGALPSREGLAEALAMTLPENAWLFLAPLVEIDLASLATLGALRKQRPRMVIIARYGLDLPVPTELAGDLVELTLPALRTSDARVVADSILGEGTDPEVARRVAVLGGETPLGVLEAARTLVACGELVRKGDTFEFRAGAERSGARGRTASISLDLLIAERAEMLDDESRQCLEALSILSEPVPLEELVAVLARDKLTERAVSRALGRLDDDAWIERATSGGTRGTVRCANVYVRHLLEASLHPARRAELHRFAYEALKERRDGPSGQAELGLHLFESGREAEGSAMLLEAAVATLSAGYGRSAARLALLARRGLTGAADVVRASAIAASSTAEKEGGLDAAQEDWLLSPQTRLGRVEGVSDEASLELFGEATGITSIALGAPGTMRIEPLVTPETAAVAGASVEPPPAKSARRPKSIEITDSVEGIDLVREVTAAIRERDAERIEQIARRAVLEGLEMSQVARLRALADLLRGDVGGAARGLVRARSLRPAAPVGRRALLTEAMVALRAGAATTAIRFALRALADARTQGDARGESVALFAMAAGYRALGRQDEASSLEERAQI